MIQTDAPLQPIFLISLPRAGSTLLQRLLATRPEVATTAETWLLLPMMYTLYDRGVLSEYNHRSANAALIDLCQMLPGGKQDYLDEVRSFALRLYTRLAPPGSKFFLDKTPRYHLIIDELLEAFPDATFLLLWRNPLAIAASMIESWGAGSWNLYKFRIDLMKGLDNLLLAYRRSPHRFKVLRYEDLVHSPENTLQDLMHTLDIPFDREMLQEFSTVSFTGRMGDDRGTKAYSSINAAPLAKWTHTFANPVRKSWARAYLNRFTSDDLLLMGYDKDELLADIARSPTTLAHVPGDILRLTLGSAGQFFEPSLLKSKISAISAWNRNFTHR